MRAVDIAGQTFCRLTAIEPIVARPRRKWRCVCSCGGETYVEADRLRSGAAKSCGCLLAELQARGNVKHGKRYTKVYRAWEGMKKRCNDENQPGYKNYGGRGIRVCERWNKFENFYADIGDPPSPHHSIDRIDNDGDYRPGNVRWATRKQQHRNKRSNRRIAFSGRTQPLAAWADETGIPALVILKRIRRGWPVKRALTGSYARRRP